MSEVHGDHETIEKALRSLDDLITELPSCATRNFVAGVRAKIETFGADLDSFEQYLEDTGYYRALGEEPEWGTADYVRGSFSDDVKRLVASVEYARTVGTRNPVWVYARDAMRIDALLDERFEMISDFGAVTDYYFFDALDEMQRTQFVGALAAGFNYIDKADCEVVLTAALRGIHNLNVRPEALQLTDEVRAIVAERQAD